ncbi:MAG TPA: hypothetical protein PLC79_11370, partial [Phycisphaerae bacterium]|nr:hypothetical protein [Phycisphaerae bacterium]
MKATRLLTGGCVFLMTTGCSMMTGTRPAQLRCEYLTNPLAIDTAQPRLSWIIESGGRGVTQSAYRILVAGSRAALAADQGDLWDSGKVASDETAQIAYAGKPLASGQEVFWKVGIWTNGAAAPVWSDVGTWRTGVLNAADVHVARRVAALSGAPVDDDVLLATALAVRAVRTGSTCVELDSIAEIAPVVADAGPLRWPDPAALRDAVASSHLVLGCPT